jgi:hypothetical protein
MRDARWRIAQMQVKYQQVRRYPCSPPNHPVGDACGSCRRGSDRSEHRITKIFTRFGLLLLALVAVLQMPAQTAHAGTLNVPCSASSLIQAVNFANLDPGTTLELAADCTYSLTAAANTGTRGPNGLPIIVGEMTIHGNGGTVIERDSASLFRIVEVSTNANLTLNNVTIRNGSASAVGGGGIANLGTLNVSNCIFSNNNGECGGAIYTKAEGGVTNRLTVTKSVFSNNTADG